MLFWLVFLAPFAGVLIYFILLQRFFNVVEREDSEFWHEIGRPHIIKNNNIGNGISVIGSFFTSSYKKSTSNVAKAGSRARLALLVFLCVMAFYPYLLRTMGIAGN